MIDISTKIHDKFSLEFKVGFAGSECDSVNNFTVSTWIFVPNSLGINSQTYTREQFYRDVKSNIRLITPTFSLGELADSNSTPNRNVRQAIKLASQPESTGLTTEAAFQIRMFAAIFKSAIRDEVKNLTINDNPVHESDCRQITDNIRLILSHFRQIANDFVTQNDITKGSENATIHELFGYANEYMSHITDLQITKLIRLGQNGQVENSSLAGLTTFLLEERTYKAAQGYSHLDPSNDNVNQELVYRHGLLKKNIESALYLKVDTEPDGAAMKQITFGFAAGIAMIISTLIALPFQKYLGSYPFVVFIILVIAYMFKDRSKELVRNLFAHQLKHKYFDLKTTIQFKNEKIGWLKEGFDFVSDAQTPAEVLCLRNRSGLESDNKVLAERTILYRKRAHIRNNMLQHNNSYTFSGIHDILRLHIQRFTQKMDDPNVLLDSYSEEGELQTIETLRRYSFHIVFLFEHNDQKEYRRFRITATRNGIVSIE